MSKNKLNIVFCGYREWAIEIIDKVSKHPKADTVAIIKSNDEFLSKCAEFQDNIDFILFLGWSWIISPEITDRFLCLGIHPSDLPDYRGGSPLQHQILNGLERTKVTLMTLSSEKLDGGDIWMKENLDLRGDTIKVIFNNLISSSCSLLGEFIENYPEITPVSQNLKEGSYFKRRQPSESEITLEQLQQMSLSELYNFIRCLSDPYPNAYISDKEGNKLLFKEVSYIQGKSNS